MAKGSTAIKLTQVAMDPGGHEVCSRTLELLARLPPLVRLGKVAGGGIKAAHGVGVRPATQGGWVPIGVSSDPSPRFFDQCVSRASNPRYALSLQDPQTHIMILKQPWYRDSMSHSPHAKQYAPRRGTPIPKRERSTDLIPASFHPRRDTGPIIPSHLLQLQRTAGNQAVQRILGGNPLKLAEEEYIVVKARETVTFTPLSAGCMAVAVYFQGGGGAAVHLAMIPQAVQWTDFLAAIAHRQVQAVRLDCDCIGGEEHWRVKMGELSPRSTWDLNINDNLDMQQQSNAGWRYDLASIKAWFTGALGGVAPQIGSNTSPRYTF